MLLDTEARHEIFGLMDEVILTAGLACIASSEETTSYRLGGVTVILFKSDDPRGPVKAQVHSLEACVSVFTVEGLSRRLAEALA